MGASFTPGPWRLVPCPCGHCDRKQLGNVGTFYVGTGFDGPDAHLIAAAPELYDLLAEAVTLFANGVGAMAAHSDADNQKHCDIARGLIHRIDNALAKARGEQVSA
jgi:hypothetical protein